MCKCHINWQYLTSSRLLALVLGAGFFWAALFAFAAQVEAPPRRLLVTVAQAVQQDRADVGGQLSGSVGRDDARVAARVWDSRNLENSRVVQTVQVIEGRSAFILVGQSRAVPQRQIARSVVGGQIIEYVVDGVDYRNADTGFYVLPRLTGNRVIVEVTPQREVFVAGRGGSTDTQRVATTVSGELGEWILVAGTAEGRGSRGEVVLGRAGSRSDEARSIYLKVDEVR